MFVLFFNFFGHFESLAFSRYWGTLISKQSDRMSLVNFSKIQEISINSSEQGDENENQFYQF